jgi:hypothetical protein
MQTGSRSLGFQDERDPGWFGCYPGFLERLPPGTGGHALARTRCPTGQDPVVAAVAGPADQENVLAAEDDS